MTIYLVLILVILFLNLADNNSGIRQDKRSSNYILLFAFVLIYLVCILRNPSVGRDIQGYQRVYDLTKNVAFGNFDYVYFENGYILLMKLCIAFGFSFQGFLAIVYLIILFPIYLFIKKYSSDKLFSTLIYICYMSFEFDLTALRQSIAISVVLLAFSVLLEERNFSYIKYIVLMFIAALFHKSAYVALVFLPLFAISSMSWYLVCMFFGTVISLFFRSYLFTYIKDLFDKDSFLLDAGLHIGGNVLFIVAVAVLGVFLQRVKYDAVDNALLKKERLSFIDGSMLKIFMFGIVLAVFFGEETASRSFMFFSQAIMVLIPNFLLKFDKKSVFAVKIILSAFFIAFFYFNSLKANNFDIVPYKFFWKN